MSSIVQAHREGGAEDGAHAGAADEVHGDPALGERFEDPDVGEAAGPAATQHQPQAAAGDPAHEAVKIGRPAQPDVMVAGSRVAIQPGRRARGPGDAVRLEQHQFGRGAIAVARQRLVQFGGHRGRGALAHQQHPVGHAQAAFRPWSPGIVCLVDHVAMALLLPLQPGSQHGLRGVPCLHLGHARPAQKSLHARAAEV